MKGKLTINEIVDKLNWLYSRYHSIKCMDIKIDGHISQIENLSEDRMILATDLEKEVDTVIKDIESVIPKEKDNRDMRQVFKLLDLISKEDERVKMRQN